MSVERVNPIKPSEIKPLRPEQIAAGKLKTLPGQVLDAFNELIAENFSDGEASITQKEAVKRMMGKGLVRTDIYSKGWLDVEEIYRQAGWKVTYDSPVYYGGENFEPYYTFSRTRRRPR